MAKKSDPALFITEFLVDLWEIYNKHKLTYDDEYYRLMTLCHEVRTHIRKITNHEEFIEKS